MKYKKLYRWAGLWCGFLLACTILGALGLSINSRGLMQPRNDSFQIDYPAQLYIEARLKEGELPLWNPYQAAGTPFLATLQHRFFYPPLRVLTALFGTDAGTDLERLFHYYLSFVGLAILFMRLKLTPVAAFAGALLAGAGINHYCISIWHANIHAVFAWGPFAILIMLDFHRRAGVRRAFVAAMVLAMLIYGGYPPAAYFVFELIAMIIITQWAGALLRHASERRRIPRVAGTLALCGCVLALLSSAVIPATAELARHGLRAYEPISVEQLFVFSVPGLNLMKSLFDPPEFLFPGLVPGVMLGIILLSWSAAFAWMPRRRRQLIPLGLYFLYIYLVCLGPLTPFGTLYKNLHPMSSVFRHPNTALSMVAGMCGLISALGLHALLRKLPRRAGGTDTIKLAPGRWSLVPVLLLPAVLIFHPRLFQLPSPGSLRPFLSNAEQSLHAKLPRETGERITTFCNNIMVFPCRNLGMVSGYPSLNFYDPLGTYRSYLYFQAIHENLDPKGQNTWLGSLVINPFDVHGQTNNTALLELAGVRYVLAHPGAFQQFLAKSGRLGPRLSAVMVPGFYLTEKNIRPPAPAVLNLDQGDPFAAGLRAFRLRDTMPRAFLHNRVRVVSSFRESARLLKAGLDPRETVILEKPATKLDSDKRDARDVLRPARITRLEPELVELSVESKGESILVLTDQFFPGWRAFVNDRPTPIFAANLLFRAIRLKPGRHVIRFIYQPWWRFLPALSALAWIVCLGVVLIRRRR